VFSGVTYTSDEEMHEAWARIKKEEKAGKEWHEDYLPVAFLEAKELIRKAEERKGFDS
jgi:tetrapyrrole methylase family protein/MazG family protein